MKQEQMKNIVVLKNLPSNLIDEAFVILKSNKKIKSLDRLDNKNGTEKNKEKQEDYIIKEAEMVIGNFLSKIEKEKQQKSYSTRQVELKYKRLKLITVILSLIIVVNFILTLA